MKTNVALPASTTWKNGLKVLALLVAVAALAWSQSARSTIVGRVTDPTGGVVTGAKITAQEVTSGFSVTEDTALGGTYSVPNLAPGKYQILVKAAGFRTEVVNDVIVNLNQTVRIDVKLTLGDVATSVEVSSLAPVIQTDSTSVGQVVDGKQISTMPLNGRQNILALLALAPGVQATAFGSSGTNPFIAGNGGFGAVNLTIDGVTGNDVGNERNLTTVPSLDGLGEFKVIASNASAEFGSGGAQIVLSSKAGTNQVHGSLFYFNRNRVTSANNFFNNLAGIANPAYNRNEYGASFGGPVKKNKLFYFATFEGFRQARAGQNVTQMPTTAMRQGDFSLLPTLKDPFNGGVPFPGNKIPSNRIGPVPQGLDTFFSAPNLPGAPVTGLGNNYLANIPVVEPVDRWSIKLDDNLTSKDRLSGRYFRSANGPFQQASPFFSNAVGGRGTEKFANWTGFGNATNNGFGQYTRMFSPTLLNEARLGVQNNEFFRTPQNANFDGSTLIPGAPKPLPGLGGLPVITILGFRGFSDGTGSYDRHGSYQISDTLTWIKGPHTLKMGFEYQRISTYNEANTSPPRGEFDFDGRYSGNSFADYLLGALYSSSRNTKNYLTEPLNNRYAGFVQDDWQVSKTLTLNLGLRYEYQAPFNNTAGDIGNWDLSLNQVVVVKGGFTDADPRLLQLPVTDGAKIGINIGNYTHPDRNNFAPRAGVAWRPFGNRFVIRTSYGIFYNVIAAFNGYLGLASTNPPFRVQETFAAAAGSTPSITWTNPFPGNGTIPSNPSVVGIARDRVNPYMQQWNYTMEYEFVKSTAMRVSYLGNKGTHLELNTNPNEPPQAPGVVQPRRPYQPWGPINYWTSGQNTILHQLELGVVRRYSSGFTLQAEYQFSRALNEYSSGATPTNNQNFRTDRGNEDGVRRHWFVANYAYDLPFGKGKPLLSGVSSPVNKLVSGWQLSGIVTMGTGTPYSVTFSATQSGWLSSRANIVSGYDAATPSNRSIYRWFNPAAYAIPAPFTFGNSARNSLFGPGLATWDAALFKTTRITERLLASFRTEFFNTLNHTNFGNPASNISTPATVGTISSTIVEPRTVQFGLRLEF